MVFVPLAHHDRCHASADQVEFVVRPPLAVVHVEAQRQHFPFDEVPPPVFRNHRKRAGKILEHILESSGIRQSEDFAGSVLHLDDIVTTVEDEGERVVEGLTAIREIVIEVALLRFCRGDQPDEEGGNQRKCSDHASADRYG